MRVAVYGGSFNPPHVGHAMVAAWLCWTEQVDEVWLVPAFEHAFGKELRPFGARVAACRALAAQVGPRVRVEEIEAELPAPSFTIRTLDALAARHPEARLRLVAGADVHAQLPSWHRWDDIAARHAPLFVNRAGYPLVAEGPVFPEVSSTEIRRRIEAGAPVDGWVPAGVVAAWAAG